MGYDLQISEFHKCTLPPLHLGIVLPVASSYCVDSKCTSVHTQSSWIWSMNEKLLSYHQIRGLLQKGLRNRQHRAGWNWAGRAASGDLCRLIPGTASMPFSRMVRPRDEIPLCDVNKSWFKVIKLRMEECLKHNILEFLSSLVGCMQECDSFS